MIISDQGEWAIYTPDPYPDGLPPYVIFCARVSDHVDWYDFRNRLRADTVKMTCWPRGDGKYIVQAVNADATMIFPQGCKLLEVAGITDADPQAAYGQKIYDPVAGAFSDPLPVATPRQLTDAEVDALIALAATLPTLREKR